MREKLSKLAALVIIFAISPSASEAEAKLLALYEFDGNVKDIVSGYNGSIVKMLSFSEGKFGQALNFDGGGDYVDIDIPEQMSQMTIAMCCKHELSPNKRATLILHKSYDDDVGSIHFFFLNNNFLTFQINMPPGFELSTTPGLAPSRWYHVAVTYDSSRRLMKLYVNGVLSNQIRDIYNRSIVIGEASIGAWPGDPPEDNSNFKGLIDDVAIFDHALSEEEITQLYREGGASFIEPEVRKLNGVLRKAETYINERKFQEAIDFLQKEITENEKLSGENIDEVGSRYKRLSSDLYFLLGKAKEAAGGVSQDVSTAYKHSLSSLPSWNNCAAASLWLHNNTSTEDYTDAVRKCVLNIDITTHKIHHLASSFESSNNWAAFELFLDVMFSQVNSPVDYVRALAQGLKKNGIWANRFVQYCQDRPELAQYILEGKTAQAQEYEEGQDFFKAAEIYRDIMNKCTSRQDKVAYELKVYECVFEGGQYENLIQKLNDFIKKYQVTYRLQVIKAMLLKGRTYIQLGKIDKAIETFLTLIIEYPQSSQSPEAAYFVGYLYMLEGEFEQATEALKLVVKDYPASNYAEKAQMCLMRIEQMTQ